MRSHSVKWNGREVQNPILRKLVVLFVVVWAIVAIPLGILGAILGIVLCVVLPPVTLPLDVVLKALGRRGFFRQEGSGFNYAIDHRAFGRGR